MEKIFAIGDIHGCYDKLIAMMDKINIDPGRDELIFLGDYIDRGPESFDVVEYLITLPQRFPKIVFLKGNHEAMLESYLLGSNRLTYLMNGGRKTLDNYLKKSGDSGSSIIPQTHMDFYNSLKLFYQTDDFIFVHAGLRKKIPIEKQSPDDLLWIRNSFINSDYDFKKRIVFGHTPFKKPMVQKNKIGIDTGAAFGNTLTCVELPAIIFHHT